MDFTAFYLSRTKKILLKPKYIFLVQKKKKRLKILNEKKEGHQNHLLGPLGFGSLDPAHCFIITISSVLVPLQSHFRGGVHPTIFGPPSPPKYAYALAPSP